MPTFFICGGKRTGTTLLENVVCAYPGVHPALPEAQLITRLMYALRWAETPDNFDSFVKPTFPRRQDLVAYFTGMVREYARRTRAIHGSAGAVVFKNPEYSLVIDELVETLPDARFLVCVRDPRDQVASEIEVVRRKGELEQRQVGGAVDAISLGHTLARYYERLLQVEREQPWRFLFVRYEDMVRDFPVTLARLDDFTGLSGNTFDPRSDWPNREEFSETAYPTYSPLYGKPVVDSSVGRFRQALQAVEIRGIERACETLMDRFGYVTADAVDVGEPGSSAADDAARLFLLRAHYSVDMPENELRGVLARIAELKQAPGLSESMRERLEAFRRAARTTLDWQRLRAG